MLPSIHSSHVARPPEAPEVSDNRRLCVLLFALLVGVYNSNLHLIPSLDSDATRVLPLCILLDHDVYLDRFADEWIKTYWHSSGPNNYTHAITRRRGHWISAYPIVTPILITPLYIPLAYFINRYNPPIDSILVLRLVSLMEKLSASIIASLSAVVVYLCLYRLSSRDRTLALLLTLVYALASNMWVIGSQSLWLHATTALFGALAIWFLLAGSSPMLLFGAGLSIALATANRPPTAILAVLLSIYAGVRYRTRCWPFLLSSSIVAVLYFCYNLYFFDTLTGEFTTQSGWTTPIATGLAGLLLNPSRGLLVYTPWTLFGFVGAVVVLSSRGGSGLLKCVALAVFGELLLYSKWWCWWGGSCFGPRLLTDILPLLTILLVPMLDRLRAWPWLKYAFVATVMASLGVQMVGAYFAFPWELEEAKVWSWRESQLVVAIREHELMVWSPRTSGLMQEIREVPRSEPPSSADSPR